MQYKHCVLPRQIFFMFIKHFKTQNIWQHQKDNTTRTIVTAPVTPSRIVLNYQNYQQIVCLPCLVISVATSHCVFKVQRSVIIEVQYLKDSLVVREAISTNLSTQPPIKNGIWLPSHLCRHDGHRLLHHKVRGRADTGTY